MLQGQSRALPVYLAFTSPVLVHQLCLAALGASCQTALRAALDFFSLAMACASAVTASGAFLPHIATVVLQPAILLRALAPLARTQMPQRFAWTVRLESTIQYRALPTLALAFLAQLENTRVPCVLHCALLVLRANTVLGLAQAFVLTALREPLTHTLISHPALLAGLAPTPRARVSLPARRVLLDSTAPLVLHRAPLVRLDQAVASRTLDLVHYACLAPTPRAKV